VLSAAQNPNPCARMKPNASVALLAYGLLFAAGAAAAEKADKSAGIGVTVADVHETRSTSAQNFGLRLVLNLSGEAVTDAYNVRRVRVTTARDDGDRDLVLPQVDSIDGVEFSPEAASAHEKERLQAVAAEVARRRAMREAAGVAPFAPLSGRPNSRNSTSKTVVNLRNPSRQSTALAILEGEITLFTPTEANGGVVRVMRLAPPGELLKNDALEQAGIQFVYFTRTAFETNRLLVGAEAKEMFNQAFQLNGADATCLVLRDPKKLVVDFELQDRDAKRIVAGTFFGGFNGWDRALFLKGPPPDGAQLLVRVATPESIKSYPFKLENIPLP
jgi:hypothetical protein